MPGWLRCRAWLAVGVLLSVILFTFQACGGDGGGADSTASPGAGPSTAAGGGGEVQALVAISYPQTARVYLREALEQDLIDTFLFVDGTKSQAMFDELGVQNFEGMYGTMPAAADPEAGARFDEAYVEATGGTAGDAHTREAYDSAYLVMLAAAAANSNDPVAIRDHLRYIANPPGMEIGFGPEEFQKALDALEAGEDIDYSGAAGSQDMDVNGDQSKGVVDVWRMVNGTVTTQETRDVDLGAVIPIEVPEGQANRAAEAPAEPLTIGVVTSLTGDRSGEGQPVANAVQMAVDEVNSAGGVFGQDVVVQLADDGTTAEGGQIAARQLIDTEGVDAIIGSLSNDVTLAIALNVTGPAGVMQISPASASPALSEADDGDFLFRAVISDAAQGYVLGDVANELGFTTVCNIYLNDPYGQGLSASFKARFEENGGTVANVEPVEEDQSTYVNGLRRCIGE